MEQADLRQALEGGVRDVGIDQAAQALAAAQVFQSRSGHLGAGNVQRVEVRQFGQVLEGGVGDPGVGKVQRVQSLESLEFSDARVSHAGGLQFQFPERGDVLEVFQALV